jgi:hypothetical protein
MREIPWLKELLRTIPRFEVGCTFGAASAVATRRRDDQRAATSW